MAGPETACAAYVLIQPNLGLGLGELSQEPLVFGPTALVFGAPTAPIVRRFNRPACGACAEVWAPDGGQDADRAPCRQGAQMREVASLANRAGIYKRGLWSHAGRVNLSATAAHHCESCPYEN